MVGVSLPQKVNDTRLQDYRSMVGLRIALFPAFSDPKVAVVPGWRVRVFIDREWFSLASLVAP